MVGGAHLDTHWRLRAVAGRQPLGRKLTCAIADVINVTTMPPNATSPQPFHANPISQSGAHKSTRDPTVQDRRWRALFVFGSYPSQNFTTLQNRFLSSAIAMCSFMSKMA